ncbi:succinate dehydrogenase cytochrome b560 subunit, mitochondrial-like [Anthonomus grandis grandis]|uniref:succinate dehydrogenase cytochrome b560 subunit, mitochondrial-like n=1 Tax=Anthonomus grandis grandis TaxID=2921223 RepID=UPI0021667360|nr:succinate dehydrogenase cytochrome b560 subunit, mitochondrial-like [Anthonomus grandis grandis]
MSLIFRLAGRSLNGPILRPQNVKLVNNFVRGATIKCAPAVAEKHESHDEKNMRLGRPQSPHLTIYKPQLTAILSISHRATGMVLTGYLVALSMAALYLPCPIEFYIEQLKCMEIGALPMFALKFFFAFPLTYHFFNGIRHLLWDTARFLTIKEVYATGYTMLLVALGTAIALSGSSF